MRFEPPWHDAVAAGDTSCGSCAPRVGPASPAWHTKAGSGKVCSSWLLPLCSCGLAAQRLPRAKGWAEEEARFRLREIRKKEQVMGLYYVREFCKALSSQLCWHVI